MEGKKGDYQIIITSIPFRVVKADLLTKILKMEEEHVDWAEVQRAQIGQMGLQVYLAGQSG